MAYVEVDIDLDEFSTSDLIEELFNRKSRKKLTKKELDKFDDLFERKSYEAPTGLVDQMKLEVILSNYQNVSYEKICDFFEKGA